LFGGRRVGSIGGQVFVESLKRRKEALHFLLPGKRLGVVPRLLPSSDGETPIEQVAHMRKNLHRGATRVSNAKIAKGGRCVANRLPSAVGDRGQGMTKQLTLGIAHHSDSAFPGVGACGAQRSAQFSTPPAGKL